jgi:hypothetical protein
MCAFGAAARRARKAGTAHNNPTASHLRITAMRALAGGRLAKNGFTDFVVENCAKAQRNHRADCIPLVRVAAN